MEKEAIPILENDLTVDFTDRIIKTTEPATPMAVDTVMRNLVGLFKLWNKVILLFKRRGI